MTVPGLLASQLATSQALAAANQQNSQDSSEAQEDGSQDSSVGMTLVEYLNRHYNIYHTYKLCNPLSDASNQAVPKIPVAPPPNIANPEKEVSVCTVL